MRKYECTICGFIYDEALGIPDEGIAPGTRWEDIPDDWECPNCGATKDDFILLGGPAEPVTTAAVPVGEETGDMRQLTALEISAVCSNLARGCEKQYLPGQAASFHELADYFKAAAVAAEAPRFDELLALIEQDLAQGFVEAKAAAVEQGDRGALRALTWSEKVTRIQKSLLNRYQKEGEGMLANTGVYVCTICGFIMVGDNPPDICPVCKVPAWKFEEMKGTVVYA